MALIYLLVDPRDESVRYVGQTVSTPAKRLREHLCLARKGSQYYSSRWIRDLLAKGHSPICVAWEETNEPNAREIFWIAHFRSLGCRLTNLTDGGEGCTGRKPPPMSPEHRDKIRAAVLGRKHTEEAKDRMRKPKTPEARANMSAAQAGRKSKPFSEQHRAHLSEAGKGRVMSDEFRRKMSERQKGIKRPPLPPGQKAKISVALKGRRPANYETLHSAENRAKAAAKNKAKPPRARLTAEQVRQMRVLYAAGGVTARSLAQRFGVAETTVSTILRGQSWEEAGGPLASSEEIRSRMAATARGTKRGPYSEEHCRNISAALTGRKLSPEHVAACVAGNRGRKLSAEQRAKLSAIRQQSHPNARLTEAVVSEARSRYAAGGVTFTDLAREYGVETTTIRNAVLRITWKSVK